MAQGEVPLLKDVDGSPIQYCYVTIRVNSLLELEETVESTAKTLSPKAVIPPQKIII